MLNYIWMALLFLGLAAAVTNDIIDQTTNKFHNNTPIKSEIIFNDNINKIGNNQPYSVKIKIDKSTFYNIYNEKIFNDLIFNAKITTTKEKNLFTINFIISDNSPPILKTIAKANGNEDDINGKIYLDKIDNQIATANLILEEVSFLKIKSVTNAAIDYAKTAVEIALGLIGIMALWLGIMKIAEEAGLINYIAKALKPITKFLFPDVPSDHPAIGSIIMNISANFLGLGNAATPFGLKAMAELNELNPDKERATDAMCTFLAINTAGLTMIPATAIAIRAAAGSSEPAIIIGTALFGSSCATIMGIIAAKMFAGFSSNSLSFIDWFKNHSKILIWFASIIIALFILIKIGFFSLIGKSLGFINLDTLKNIIQIISIIAIPLIIAIFVSFGFIKKVKVYESFIEGAKEGFNVAIRIIPFLVGMLMAIGIFRAGGAMDWLVYVLKPFTDLIGMPAEALPMALMRPLSGSGALGVMAEIISVHGADSFIGILVSTFYGSSETTFYVLAVYFGSVSIKQTRYAVAAGLLADVAGILGALFIVRLLFG